MRAIFRGIILLTKNLNTGDFSQWGDDEKSMQRMFDLGACDIDDDKFITPSEMPDVHWQTSHCRFLLKTLCASEYRAHRASSTTPYVKSLTRNKTGS